MKNVLRSICIFGILFLCLAGCKNNLLPRPDLGTGSLIDVGSAWGAPQGVTASQGLKGKIDLQWTPVKKAVRYYIYKADTPFSNYVQIGETSDSTASYSVVVSAGTDAYFKLKAVDINGKESSFSTAVRGTSLARPVISDIVGDSEAGDTSVTVYWYMNNLDAYSDNVRYDVVCLDSSGKEQLRISVSSGKSAACEPFTLPSSNRSLIPVNQLWTMFFNILSVTNNCNHFGSSPRVCCITHSNFSCPFPDSLNMCSAERIS